MNIATVTPQARPVARSLKIQIMLFVLSIMSSTTAEYE